MKLLRSAWFGCLLALVLSSTVFTAQAASAQRQGKADSAAPARSGQTGKAGQARSSLSVVKPVAATQPRNARSAKVAKSSKTSKSAQSKPSSTRKAAKPSSRKSRTVSTRQGRSTSRVKARNARPAVRVAAPPRLSFGEISGLRDTSDPLDLESSVAFVVDQDTNEILVSKNPGAVLPIASLTKLMTAFVVTSANQPLDEVLTVTQEDIDTEKGSGSRLSVGAQLTRGEMLHLALMSSENRAANALGRHYPGGLPAFVSAMNAKAALLGMQDTHYVEPTGLSSKNQSSARDLARLVNVAHGVDLIRELSTSPQYQVQVGARSLQYRTTNRLVLNPSWDIGLQKTGYISEAGRCLVMQASLAGRKLIMVLLDSAGKYSRLGDAERIRKWVSEHAVSPSQTQPMLPMPALPAVAPITGTGAPKV